MSGVVNPGIPAKVLSVVRWIVGALHKPNGIRLNAQFCAIIKIELLPRRVE